MNKYVLISIVFLGAVALYFYHANTLLKKDIVSLTAEKNAFISEIERRNKSVKELQEAKEDIERASRDDKTNFDWNRDISYTGVIVKLRKD